MSSAREAPSIYTEGAATGRPMIPRRVLHAGAPAWASANCGWRSKTGRSPSSGCRRADSYDGYGMPFAVSMQSQPFSPPTALLALHPSRARTRGHRVSLVPGRLVRALFLRLFADRVAVLAAGVADRR